MFEFVKRLFGISPKQDDQADRHQKPIAPGTQIRHDPGLVEQLKNDHQNLLTLYGEVIKAFEAADYKGVTDKLREFRTDLQGHLLTENLRLYVYLEHLFAHDETNYELIHGFRREMDGIARTALTFLKKYEAIGVDADLEKAFKEDFAIIGKVLGERIHKEEATLYPLYAADH